MSANLSEFLVFLVMLFPAPKNLPDEKGYWAQSVDEFQKTFNELYPKGWRLMRIKGYEKDGASHFDSEWHKPSTTPPSWCHHHLDSAEYENRTSNLKNTGFKEVLKSTWKVKGEERIWAVWEAR